MAASSMHLFTLLAFAFTLFYLSVVINNDQHQIMAMAASASTPAGTVSNDYGGYDSDDYANDPPPAGNTLSQNFSDSDPEGTSYFSESESRNANYTTNNHESNNGEAIRSTELEHYQVSDSNRSKSIAESDEKNPALTSEKHGRRSLLSRRSLLPSGTIIKDKASELQSHVVIIKSRRNGFGTGLLMKKKFVLTAKSVVMSYVDPYEFTIQLQDQFSNGFDVFTHPHKDLAVIKIHPPIEDTGRVPAPNSPKGFFWPIAMTDPNPNSAIKLYGYGGGSFGFYTSKARLNFKSYKTVNDTSKHHITIQTRTVISTTTGDVGGPAFISNGTVLAGVVTPSRKPSHGALISLSQQREWIFNAMKTTCNKEQEAFTRLIVGEDINDVLVSYHCKVDRAEQIRLYMFSKSRCKSNWKSIVITGSKNEVFARLETNGKNSTMSVKVTKKDLDVSNVFYIQLWKDKLAGNHTLMATHGPFEVEDFIDGGLHFDWCEA